MGRPPVAVIVARHGARLDAADKQWHLTSPTPYDPPLTYGGWTQCRALGARIASLLQTREDLSEASTEIFENSPPTSSGEGQHKNGETHGKNRPHHARRKKHKIIIHSSPFLRCVQTSVAISAGISQYRGQHETAQAEAATQKATSAMGPPPKTTDLTNSPSLSAILDEDLEPNPSHNKAKIQTQTHLKPRLRIDAFLGEWLSPDYYENITSPPSSVMMVAGAKADLLRRGEFIDTAEDLSRVASTKGNFPGGWGSLSGSSTPKDETDFKLSEGFSDMSLKFHLRERASTQGSRPNVTSNPENNSQAQRANPTISGYVPPIPRYAISPSDHIPSGYVGHARDACIEVDYQWDSMRAPQDWGDGGEYGEEWSSMHKRFRKGLQSMISWYKIHHETNNQVGGHKRVRHPHPTDEDDEDTDIVLVLVTHGAGCNALIGALTNQPVLLDVSMASLTMATRKEGGDRPDSTQSSHSPSSRRDEPPLSTEYTVQLTASTDHLRAASSSQPLQIPILNNQKVQHSSTQSQPSNVISSAPGPRVVPRRNRFDTMPTKPVAPIPTNGTNDPTPKVGIQRSASTAVGRSGSGLWSAPGAEEKPKRTWTMGSAGTATDKPEKVKEEITDAPGQSGGIQGEGTKEQIASTDFAGKPEEPKLTQKSGTTVATTWSPKSSEEKDIVSPLGSAGLWGGGGGRHPSFSKGLPRPGLSAMAMALRGGDNDDEITERERGPKRRWTVGEREEG